MLRVLNFLKSVALRSLGVLLLLFGVWLWFVSSDRELGDQYGVLAEYGAACLAWMFGGIGVALASGQKLRKQRD